MRCVKHEKIIDRGRLYDDLGFCRVGMIVLSMNKTKKGESNL